MHLMYLPLLSAMLAMLAGVAGMAHTRSFQRQLGPLRERSVRGQRPPHTHIPVSPTTDGSEAGIHWPRKDDDVPYGSEAAVEPSRDSEEVGKRPSEAATSSMAAVATKPFPLLVESDEDIVRMAGWASYCTYTPLVNTPECRARLEEHYEYLPVLLATWETGIPSGWDTDYAVKANVALVLIERAAPATRRHRRLYVAFTGTEGFADFLTDGSFSTVESRLLRSREGTPFAKMHSHRGFHIRKELVYPHLRSILRDIPMEDLLAMEVIVCGHSMGSAVAVLTAMDLYHDFGFDVLGGKLNALNQFKIVTMGSIQVVSRSAGFFLGHLNHVRIHNDKDAMGALMLAGSRLLGATAQAMRRAGRLTHGAGHWTIPVQQFTGIKAQVSSEDMHRIGQFCRLYQSLHGTVPALDEMERANWRAVVPTAPPRSRGDITTDHSMLAYHVLAVEAFKSVKDLYAGSRPDPIEAVRRLSMSIADRLRMQTCSRVMARDCIRCVVANTQEAHCWLLDREGHEVAIGQYDMIDSSGMLGWTRPMAAAPSKAGFEACFHTLVLEGTPGTTINAGKIGDRLGTKTYLIDFAIKTGSPALPTLAREHPDLFGALFVTSRMCVPFHCARVMQAPKRALETPNPAVVAMIENDNMSACKMTTFAEDGMKYVQRVLKKRAATGHKLRFLDCTIEANRPWCPAVCRDTLAAGSLLLNDALRGMCSMVASLSGFPIDYGQRSLFAAVAPQLPPLEDIGSKNYAALYTGRLARTLRSPFGEPYGIALLRDKKALLADPSRPVHVRKTGGRAMGVRRAAKKQRRPFHRK